MGCGDVRVPGHCLSRSDSGPVSCPIATEAVIVDSIEILSRKVADLEQYHGARRGSNRGAGSCNRARIRAPKHEEQGSVMSYQYFNQAPNGIGLGTLMRQNPVPAGRYWIDTFGDNRSKMAAWATTNQATVQVEDVESFEENSGGPARDFYIFKVTAPTPWDAITFGYPTVANSSVKTSDDTVQRPQVESTADILQGAADTVGKIAFWGAIIVGGVLVLRTMDALGFMSRKA